MSGTPAAEVHIDLALVRALLEEQHPDLAKLPIEQFASGWDNMMFRLGADLVIRMPRRIVAVPLIEHEQNWLPQLPELPVAIPAPVRTGVAGCGYPWPWSVVPWVPGEAADLTPPMPGQAVHFVQFLRALHRPAPLTDALPINLHRGCRLADKVEGIVPRFERLSSVADVITPNIRAIWSAALAAKPSSHPVWLHGDLHARNVVVNNGMISAIIDWGDICAGDAATDLMSIWALFDDPAARQTALQEYGASADLVARAKGWVVLMAAILLDTSLQDEPRHAKMGADMFRRLEEDGF
jgi:aminoglycoside phosphotransferase (APT) family kinase protein